MLEFVDEWFDHPERVVAAEHGAFNLRNAMSLNRR
jgi:hypothetical protein